MARGRARTKVEGDGPEEAEGTDRQFVTSIARGFKILSAFKDSKPLGNQELAKFTDMPRPTVSRLTYTLTELGYLRYLPDFAKYELGPAALSLGFIALSTLEVRRVARPFMQELAERFNINMTLAVPERRSMVCIEACDGAALVGLRIAVGTRFPMSTTAVGRAYLAGENADTRAQMLAQLQYEFAAEWPERIAGIERAIADVAKRGFCESYGEWHTHINSIAVPITSPEGRGVCGMAAGAPAFLMPKEKLENEIAPLVVVAGKEIEKRLNGG